MKNVYLYLLRSGLSEDAKAGLLSGKKADSPLSAEGKAALADMAQNHVYPAVEAVFVSPLRRAGETAAILYPNQPRIVIAELSEADFGPAERMAFEALQQRDFFVKWQEAALELDLAGGEAFADFQRRISAALSTLVAGMMKSGVQRAAVVTHGSVIAHLLARHALPRHTPEQRYADPGAGYQFAASSLWLRSGVGEVRAIVPTGWTGQILQQENKAEETNPEE